MIREYKNGLFRITREWKQIPLKKMETNHIINALKYLKKNGCREIFWYGWYDWEDTDCEIEYDAEATEYNIKILNKELKRREQIRNFLEIIKK